MTNRDDARTHRPLAAFLLALAACSAPADAGWQLSFSDEFSGTTVDWVRWKPSDAWNNRTYVATGELQCYMPDSFAIGDGTLSIIAERRVPANCRPNPGYLKYTSGMITTAKSFNQRYGYFEIRARLPKGQGLWPAFWLLPADRSSPPETDVMEAIGSNPNSVQMTNHWWNAEDQSRQGSGSSFNGPDFTADFHTFGVDWQPQRLTWYVDGVKRREFTGPLVMDRPAYLLANLAIGGAWAGAPDDTTEFPARMQIDYIRVYKRVADGQPDQLPPFAKSPDVPVAPTLVRGRTMGQTTNTSGAPYQDSATWALWNNGYIQSTVAFPQGGTYEFTLRMGGNSVDGIAPKMELRIDGVTLGSLAVDRGWQPVNYKLRVPIEGGQHLVAIALTNGYDWQTGTGDYRFLLVDRMAIALPATKTASPDGGGLYVSRSADRSDPLPLDGATLSGPVHVFYSAAEAATASARFMLDGVVVKHEHQAPFDLAGTGADGRSLPFAVDRLSAGWHTLAVRRTLRDGAAAEAILARFRRE